MSFGRRDQDSSAPRRPSPASGAAPAATESAKPAVVPAPAPVPARVEPVEQTRRHSEEYYDVKTSVFNALIDTIDLTQLAKLEAAAAREEIREIVGEILPRRLEAELGGAGELAGRDIVVRPRARDRLVHVVQVGRVVGVEALHEQRVVRAGHDERFVAPAQRRDPVARGGDRREHGLAVVACGHVVHRVGQRFS